MRLLALPGRAEALHHAPDPRAANAAGDLESLHLFQRLKGCGGTNVPDKLLIV